MGWGWMGRNGDEWGGCRVMWGVWVYGCGVMWGGVGWEGVGGFSLESRPYTVVVYLTYLWLSI